MSRCDECSGLIDQSGYCTQCGLESLGSKETQFIKSAITGANEVGEVESRHRKVRIVALKQGRWNRGFVCNRCRELFENSARNDAVVEFESRSRGFEQPGTSLYTFMTRQDLRAHIFLFHEGKRFADKLIRRMNAEPFQKESGENK